LEPDSKIYSRKDLKSPGDLGEKVVIKAFFKKKNKIDVKIIIFNKKNPLVFNLDIIKILK